MAPRGPARPPRVPPLALEERTDAQRELLARVDVAGGPAGEARVFTTLVRAPHLFARWLPFGGALLRGALPPRDRELLILRTAVNCAAPYEWGQHARLGRLAGLRDDELDAVAVGPEDPTWDPSDAALLRVADELHATSTLSDEGFAALAGRYDDAQVIEALFVVGHYHLVAMALNALGVEPEPELDALPDVP